MRFYTGALEDNIDIRDKELDHITFGKGYFDWNTPYDVEQELGFRLPVKDQQTSYSCVGQAIATYAYVLDAFELLPVYKERLHEYMTEFSARDIYSQISLGQNQGAYIRDGVKSLINRGVNKEVNVPSYLEGKASETFLRDKTWKKTNLSYTWVNQKAQEYRVIRDKHDMDLIAQMIEKHHGVLLGVSGSNNQTWRSKFPEPPISRQWGHVMYAGKAKLINGAPHIGCAQSWGEGAGDKGWQWFGPAWFKSGHVFNPWVIIDKPNLFNVYLVDKNGKQRNIPPMFHKIIRYLIEDQGYTFKH